MIRLTSIFGSAMGLAMMAGCSQGAPAGDKAQAAEAPAGPHAAPGTFVRTGADGKMTTVFLAKDDTYTSWVGGAMTESGKWAVKDNKNCFTPAKGAATCSADGPIAADGSFTETPDQGAPYTVRKSA